MADERDPRGAPTPPHQPGRTSRDGHESPNAGAWPLAWRAVLVAVVLVAVAITGALLSTTPQQRRWFDNTHWTLSYTSAALLAWLGVRHAASADRAARRWFARGLSAYAFGQVLWDVQVLVGWNPFPGPSDLFYLLLGPCCAVGFAIELRERTTPQRRQVAALDAAAVAIATLALTLATYLPLRGHHTAFQMVVLMSYPVGLSTAACIGLVLVPTLRLRAAVGWIALLAAMTANAGLWMSWNARTLEGTLADGTVYNALFSVTALVMGVGAMRWRTPEHPEERWERYYEGVLRLAPLLVVVGAALAMLIVTTHAGVSPFVLSTTAICAAAVVMLAIVRQGLLLRERDQLLEAERMFRTLFDSAPDGILLLAGERFVDCNPSAARMFGLSREELCLRTPFDLSPDTQPDGRTSREAGAEYIHAAIAGRQPLFPWQHQRADGTRFDAEVTLVAVARPHGALIQATVRDVTDRIEAEATRQRLEEQLRQAAKLEAVGRLAGGVAHDFNNLLTVILGTLELAQLRLRPGDPIARDITETRAAAQRAAGLTAQLLAFSRKQVVTPVVLDLTRRVEQTLELVRRLIGEDIALDFRGTDACSVLADPTQLEQVLVNLAVNARDAMPGGGRLTIVVRHAELDEATSRTLPGARPGAYGCLAVEDTGPGVPADIAARVFEPFFTTKAFGRGTGLGLATVRSVMEQCGGFVVLDTAEGRGARFECYFPEVAGHPQPQAPSTDAALRGGLETILLVEDEPTLRELVERMLTTLGYRTITAESGPGALSLPPGVLAGVDLVLTDVIMPGMSGRQMYELLRASRPTLPVVYMSGYTDQIIAPHGVLEPGTHFLQKPFTQADLAAVLRTALERAATHDSGR
ncbi:MAG: ATP-binding protein [Candidatus Eisenbacteria bacterium]